MAETPPRPPRQRRWPGRGRLGGDRGATAVELAIVAPAILLLIAGGVQAAVTMHTNTLVLAAAQQGADAGRLYDAPPGAGAEAAHRFLQQGGGGLLAEQQVEQDQTAGTVTITITARTVAVIPGPWTRIRKTASGPRELLTGTTG